MPPTTSSSTILLREHQTTRYVRLSTLAASQLGASGAGIRVQATDRPGWFDLRASSIVGSVVLGDVQVIIRPKIPVRRLLHLFSFSSRGIDFGGVGRLDDDFELLDVMAEQYMRLLQRSLSRGLVREYIEEQAELPGLRGRVDGLHVVTRRFGVIPPVRCSYAEFSVDTVPNQLLLSACTLLTRSRLRGSILSRFPALVSRLEGVSPVLFPPQGVPHPRLDRRYDHSKAAVRFAELILRRMSIELRDGALQALTFLVDMNVLYEEFVVEGLRRALKVPTARWIHHPAHIYLDTDRRLQLRPDALWRDHRRRPLLVVDAKYKDVPVAVSGDVYQMLAYCQAVGVGDAVLVYASTVPDRHVVANSGVRIHRLQLNPDGTPQEIEERLDAAAATLRRIARHP